MVHKIWQDYPEIAQELLKVKHIMKSELQLKVPEVEAKVREYMEASGKYLRAGLCLMFAQLTPEGITESKRYTAAAIEVFHLATLIHDDVIDQADHRRGIQSLHIQASNRVAIYAGDYLMAFAARLLSKAHYQLQENPLDSWIMESILVGELNQMANQFKLGMTMYDYLRQIRGKTALLFAAATFSGFYSLQHSAWKNKQAFYIGQAIGMAFQLQDDLIDYRAPISESGKPRMQDVQNGIYTAPLIFALQENPKLTEKLLLDATLWTQESLDDLQQALLNAGVYAQTERLIQQYVSKAQKRLTALASTEQERAIMTLISRVM